MSSPKGYVLGYADGSDFYIPGALHVERNDELFSVPDDETAARMAEKDGISLIYGMKYVPDGVYVDTPENREAILRGLEMYPEYKQITMSPCPMQDDPHQHQTM